MAKERKTHWGLSEAASLAPQIQPTLCHFGENDRYAYKATRDPKMVSCQSCLDLLSGKLKSTALQKT